MQGNTTNQYNNFIHTLSERRGFFERKNSDKHQETQDWITLAISLQQQIQEPQINDIQHRTKQSSPDGWDRLADFFGTGMDGLYVGCNLYVALAAAIKGLAAVAPYVGIVWNFIDAAGALAISLKAYKDKDNTARNWNAISSAQLSGMTAFTTYALVHPTVHALSLAGTATGGVGFAAAMGISWYIEKEATEKCDKKIGDFIDNFGDIIVKGTTTLQNYHQEWCKAKAESSEKRTSKRNEFLTALGTVRNAIVKGSAKRMDKDKPVCIKGAERIDALKAVIDCQHTVRKRVKHNRARRVWKYCTCAMLAVAAGAVVAAALGASVATAGVAPLIAASALGVFSGVYRLRSKYKSDQQVERQKPQQISQQAA